MGHVSVPPSPSAPEPWQWSQCNGEGNIIKNKCKACAGEGIVYGEEVVEVKIPAGVAEGMQLSVNGKGNAGKHNGVPGDLLVVIEEESHPDLIRDENDLIYNMLLSVPTAALGGTVEIPTIDSKVTYCKSNHFHRVLGLDGILLL